MAEHADDGYGPPPSKQVSDAVAPFLSDDKPPPHDPALATTIAERIERRRIPWRSPK